MFWNLQIGWVCSACTYINKPTRPGCEVCTQTRPPDYKIPENYVLSPQEKDWLEKEARLERQTKEVKLFFENWHSNDQNINCNSYASF